MNLKDLPSDFSNILSACPPQVSVFATRILSEVRPEAKRSFQRNSTRGKVVTPQELLSPLGVCRYVIEIASAQTHTIHSFFTRFVPRNDVRLQWLHGLYLGPDGFQELVNKNFNEAARLVRMRTQNRTDTARCLEWIDKALTTLPVNTFCQTIQTLSQLETWILHRPDEACTEIVRDLQCVLKELDQFVKTCTDGLLCKRIERKMKRITSVVDGLRCSDVQHVFLEQVQQHVQQHVQEDVGGGEGEDHQFVEKKEYNRLCDLLEKHNIDYIEIPSDSLEKIRAFIEDQKQKQQVYVRVLFSDEEDVNDAKRKFEAENQIEHLQKNIDTAERKQFEFQEFVESQKACMEVKYRDGLEQVRQKYLAMIQEFNLPPVEFVQPHKLSYKVRSTLFADSDTGPLVATSTAALKCWWALVHSQTEQVHAFLKVQEVRKALLQIWESRNPQKVILGCMFYFATLGHLSSFDEPFRQAWKNFVLYAANTFHPQVRLVKPNNLLCLGCSCWLP